MHPLGRLKYLYIGSSDVGRDVAWYRDTLGARIAWDFEAFGTRVAAVEVAEGPLVLLAGHREAGTVLPCWAVDDLEAAVGTLRARGWKPDEGPFGLPDGDAYLFHDPSGNGLVVFGNERPDALVARYEAGEEGAVPHAAPAG